MKFFTKKQINKKTLDKGLEKTRTGFFSKVEKIIKGKSKVDIEFLDNLEEVLISADVGVDTTLQIIERLEDRVSRDKYIDSQELNKILKEEILKLLIGHQQKEDKESLSEVHKPYVIMVVGVNGVGKTTTIGKLAYAFKKEGKSVIIGAADTFRAAAIDQLEVWANRVGCKMIKQKMGSDPASVAYDTLVSAKTQGLDIAIIDTAGRLHNKVNLMNELTKIKNVIQKAVPNSSYDVMLVIDSSTGQNAFHQAKSFSEATEVTSLAVTKLDGTAKGGVVIGISNELKVPVKYIGVGEGIEDLYPFDAKQFAESFFTVNKS